MAFDPTTDSWAPGEPPVGNASALPPDPDKPTGSLSPQRPTDFLGDLQARHDKVSGALAGEYGKYTEATSVLDQMEQQRVERDRGRMDQAFNLESAAANDPALNHPWNADKERSERIRGPLENFGSVGVIFALAASAFTRTPMTSALTAAGAAMTAMRQSDEEGYKTAYEAWKANSDLAIKRFNIERNLYEDANKLVSTDLGLWRQKRASIAAQFDDRKRQIMLDNGMDAEVLKADEAFTKAGEQAIDYQKKFEDINLEKDIWQSKFAEWKQAHPPADPNNLTPQEHLEQYKAKNQFMLEAKHQVAQSKSVARTGSNPNQQQYDLIRQKYEGDPDAETKIADEYAQFIRNQKVTGGAGGGTHPGTPSDDNQKMDADIKAEHPDWSASQIIEERNKRIKASKDSTRPSAQSENAKTLADVKADVKKEHPDWTAGQVDTEANKRVAQSKAVISGNRADDLRGQIGRIDRANEVIDRVEALMKTHKMITGLGGTISRRGEVIGNVLGGSNSTAYNEFKSDLAILKDWWERLENNALTQGRPLSAAEKRVGDIIPGLSIGDTVQHTADQLNRVKKIFTEMRAENEGRLKGEAPSAAPPAAKPSWRTLAIPEGP
jgi:hypothetical protein